MSQPPVDPPPAESRMEGLAYTLGFGARRRAEVDQQFQERYAPGRALLPPKNSLTSGQHILHLLLSMFTCGLWLPVWIIRAAQGNRQPPPQQQPSWAYPPPEYQQQPGYAQQWEHQQPYPGYQPRPEAGPQQRGQ